MLSPGVSTSIQVRAGSPPPPARPGRPRDGLDRPAPLACTECRRKHVRCDATSPICLRCAAAGTSCHYLPSRRGLKRRADELDSATVVTLGSASLHSFNVSSFLRRGTSSIIQGSPSDTRAAQSAPTTPGATPATPRPSPSTPGIRQEDATIHVETGHRASRPSRRDPREPAWESLPTDEMLRRKAFDDAVADDEALINLYYANFHACHPILVPRTMYSSQHYPGYLRLVVHFIGSHFSSTMSGDSLRAATAEALTDADQQQGRRGYHLVQARLLFSIALHARNEIRESVSVLAQAVALALDLGMHRKSFCLTHGRQVSMEEESLRRTWWELYVTDGYVAALQRSPSFRCHSCGPDVPLPCDESLYVEGAFLMEPPTVEQFDARVYAEEELQFSSFCYRIEAVRILARALSISCVHEVQEEQVQAIDNALAAWRHNLAVGKTNIHDAFGQVDEMLFQAHMLIQYTTIYLHFWRSELAATVPAAFDIIRERHLPPVSTRHTHGIKAIEASKQLADLAALGVPVQKHTPFFVFALVFSAIVQLSACSLHGPDFRELYRDRLALITGVLKTLSPNWAFAQVVVRKVKRMTADLLRARTGEGAVESEFCQDSGVDLATPGVALRGSDFPWIDLLSWDPGAGSL